MQASSIPTKFAIPFANGAGAGFINAVPQASQIGVTPGAASLTDGFVPLNFTPVGAGGIPPFGKDFNGILNQITAWVRFAACAGGLPLFDSTFSTSIGGYPQGALIAAIAGVTAGSPQGGNHLWLSAADNNTVNPDTTFNSANWIPLPAVIDQAVTYTVGGTASQFTDLNAAFEYLSKFEITRNGSVTLQYAAGQFIYNATGPTIAHPNGDRISILGATMLAAMPVTDTGYTLSGSSSGQRSSDTSANLTTLRTKFATELRMTGGAFVTFNSFIKNVDGILFTSDGSGSTSLLMIYDNARVTFSGPNGVAATGSPIRGIEIGRSGALSVLSGGAVVTFGNGFDGIELNTGAFLFVGGTILSFSNGLSGIQSGITSCVGMFSGSLYSECNATGGITLTFGSSAFIQPSGSVHLYKNGGWGSNVINNSTLSINNADYGSGSNANASGSATSNVASSTSGLGSCSNVGTPSPPIATVGNNNSINVS